MLLITSQQKSIVLRPRNRKIYEALCQSHLSEWRDTLVKSAGKARENKEILPLSFPEMSPQITNSIHEGFCLNEFLIAPGEMTSKELIEY